MKTKSLFLIFISLYLLIRVTAVAQSPGFTWAKEATGQFAWGVSSAADAAGNVVLLGSFRGRSIVIGTDTLVNADTSGEWSDIYMVKYNASGNMLWLKHMGGSKDDEGANVCTDAVGNIYITGSFIGPSIAFGTDTLTTLTGAYSAFTAKYDASGNELWAKNSGPGVLTGSDITTDPFGNVFITGWFGSGSMSVIFGTTTLTGLGSFEPFVVKYDASGNVLWAKSFGGSNEDRAYALSTDAAGKSYIAGFFSSSSITFGATTITNSGPLNTEDMFIVKYDPSGNEVWAKNAGGALNDEAYDITTDTAGNSYVTGFLNSPHTTPIEYAFGSAYAYISKYDAGGNLLWTKNAGGATATYGSAVTMDPAGNILITGGFPGATVVWGSDTLTNVYTDSSDVFIVKYDPSGNELWSKGAGGIGNDEGSDISTDANGNIFVAGSFNSPTLTLGTAILTNTGSIDTGSFFLAKIKNITSVVWPGDANANFTVDNTDLLPIGLYYGQTGSSRTVMGNVWQADTASDWGITETTGVDIKNADCNGDGIIDNNDTLAVNLNFTMVHAIAPISSGLRAVLPDLYFVTSAASYTPGQTMDVQIWAGTSSDSVSSLYGLSFNIDYDAAAIQSGTETLDYPNSWLGSPGTNAIKISKISSLAHTAYGAETRINHTNTAGYGKIADFKLKIKNTITSTDSIHFTISSYVADDASGANVFFNAIPLAVQIVSGTAGISEIENTGDVTIYPNPYSNSTTINYTLTKRSEVNVEVYDVIGNRVETLVNAAQSEGQYSYQFSAKQKGYDAGVYFVKITVDGKAVMKRVVEMK